MAHGASVWIFFELVRYLRWRQSFILKSHLFQGFFQIKPGNVRCIEQYVWFHRTEIKLGFRSHRQLSRNSSSDDKSLVSKSENTKHETYNGILLNSKGKHRSLKARGTKLETKRLTADMGSSTGKLTLLRPSKIVCIMHVPTDLSRTENTQALRPKVEEQNPTRGLY